MYLLVGVLTTVINYIVYLVCRELLPESEGRMFFANSAAWVVAVLFAYVANRRLVFHSDTKSLQQLREFAAFVAARVLSLFLDMGLLYAAVYLLGWDDRVGKLVANVAVILANYVLSKTVIFKKRGQGSPDA